MKPGAQLRMLITELSKTKEGFTPDDAEHIKASSTYVSKVCCTMIAQGLLFRSKAAGYPVRYHDTQYSSWAWEANTPARKRVRIRKSRAN